MKKELGTILFHMKILSTTGTFDYRSLINTLNLPSMDSLDVLDVGCSDGFFSKYFLDNLNANYVLGLDINKYDGSVAFDVLKSYEK